MGSFRKLKELLEEKNNFLLVCHIEPDGDAVGSTVSLSSLLKSRNKEVTILCKDLIPEVFQFIDGASEFVHKWPEKKFDAVILLDNGDSKRTGFCEEIQKARAQGIPIINIDHHSKNDLWKIVTVNYIDENASSTSEIVYRILSGLKIEVSPSTATALLSGIFYDTGGFKHANTTDAVFEIVSELLRCGGNLRKITKNIGNSFPVPKLKLWGIALSRLKFIERYGLSVSVLTQADLEETGALEDDISGFVNLLNSAPESKAALLLYETEAGKIKGSLRTERDNIDVSKLAELLGGGGHRKAAGFTLEGKIVRVDRDFKII